MLFYSSKTVAKLEILIHRNWSTARQQRDKKSLKYSQKGRTVFSFVCLSVLAFVFLFACVCVFLID